MSFRSDIAALNNVGLFGGGNVDQMNHLNEVVNTLNGVVNAATNNAEDAVIAAPPLQSVDIWINGQRMVLSLHGTLSDAIEDVGIDVGIDGDL